MRTEAEVAAYVDSIRQSQLEAKRKRRRDITRRYRQSERVRQDQYARYRQWYQDNIEEQRARGRRNAPKKYGIDQQAKESILEKQGGRCAICTAKEAGGRGGWHVDHDHKTGLVRGLLCHSCNVALGHFGDSVDTLLSAIEYLKKHSHESS